MTEKLDAAHIGRLRAVAIAVAICRVGPISLFDDDAGVRLGMTELDDEGRSAVLAGLYGGADGGTNLEAAALGGVEALSAAPLPGQPGVVFLLSDGGAEADDAVLEGVGQLGIPIFTFEFGPEPMSNSPMRTIAEVTGGEYAYSETMRGQDLTAAYQTLAGQLIDSGEHSDGDALSDCVETRGMLTGLGSYGAANVGLGPNRYIRTNPNAEDTDKDGLWDDSEMGAKVHLASNPALVHAYSFLYAAGIDGLWSPRSDPNTADTDREPLLDPQEVSVGTLAFDEDTDNDTATDYEEVIGGLTDPLVADEFIDHRIPGIKPGTLLVPRSFMDGSEKWLKHHPQSLISVFDPDTGLCISADVGCAAIKDYVQSIFGTDERGYKHNPFCLYIRNTCQIDDVEAWVVAEIVDAQEWWTANGVIRDDRLIEILRKECVLLAYDPSECTDGTVEHITASRDNPRTWDGVVDFVAAVIALLPGGRIPDGVDNRVKEQLNTLQGIIERVKKANPRGEGEGAAAYGTRIHSALKKEIDELENPNLWAEVSYKDGIVEPYGTPGSVRPDVISGPRDTPWAVVDFKTGISGIRNSWERALSEKHLPELYRKIPIIGWFV